MANYDSAYLEGIRPEDVKYTASIKIIHSAIKRISGSRPSDVAYLKEILHQVLAEAFIAEWHLHSDKSPNFESPELPVPTTERTVPVWVCPDA